MISTTSKHALRVLGLLPSDPDLPPAAGRDLAARADIPANYLAKILHALTRVGLVEASRGRGGGYRLSRPAEQVRLIDIVEPLDGIKTRPTCVLGLRKECSDATACSAHESFRHLRRVYLDFLEKTTLADISPEAPVTEGGPRRRGSTDASEARSPESAFAPKKRTRRAQDRRERPSGESFALRIPELKDAPGNPRKESDPP